MDAAAEERRAWVTLLRIPGLTYERVARGLQAVGSAAELAQTADRRPELLELSEHARLQLRALDTKLIDGDLAWLDGPQRHLVPLTSPDYPALLAHAGGAPPALYVMGSVQVLSQPQLAIVGSRNPTASGRDTAFDFAAHLARCGLTITSGLAEGIDAAGHRGALSAGRETLAVCGTGLDVVYPEHHAELARSIAAHGALVSEFPPGTAPRREYFPQRNRIISGLSLGTLVVEAARQSGSLITARHATEQGREVFAIPGSIHNPMSRGCHRLIRDGAKLVETAEDILSELHWNTTDVNAPAGAAKPEGADSGAGGLDKEYEILLDALGFDALGPDALIERSGLKPEAVASMLLILELRGLVEARPGGRYCRSPTRR
ncbi:MAG TPA: DNA-processing protein DprA [Steroidobacteraceae bacterium]|nr:DNA-processing protein DprA [Steroidobacteraceae bacterium]